MKNNWLIFFAAYMILIGFLCGSPKQLNKVIKGETEIYYKYNFDTHLPYEKLGEGMIVFCDNSSLHNLPKDYSAITVSVKADAEEIIKILRLNVKFRENSLDVVSIYGYSPLIKGGIVIDGFLINVQIAAYLNEAKVGSPIIVGAF